MKTLEELGISPAPWSIEYDDTIDRVVNILGAKKNIIVETDCGYYPPELPDARLMSAAPELYEALAAMLSCAEKEATFTVESRISIAMDMARKAIKRAGGEE